jgi:tetratricopeptide (TPR) repeat protein
MTELGRLSRGLMQVAAAAFAFAFLFTGALPAFEAGSAKAASKEDARKEQREKAAAAARAAYDAGLKAFAKAKYQSAVDELSKAVKAGSLTNAEMAKALYTRGLAYKKQEKPGLAISDLTSALWLKNGLSADDRKKATAERSEAYKMAGIQDTGEGLERAVVANPNTSTSTSTATSAGTASSSAGLSAAAVAQSAAAHSGSGADDDSDGTPQITRQDANSEAAKDAARARAAYGTVHGNGLQAAASATVVGNSASADSPKVVTVTPSTSSSITSSVSNFFSNMFGGGTPAPPEASQQPASVTTASTSPVEPEVSAWSSATSVTGAHSEPAAAPQKAATHHSRKTAATSRKAKPRGKYKVHIAALRSREDAEALAHKLVAQHAADLDNHTPTVDKAVIGSMGTFYRVRIGGYASADEPRSLCNKLRTSGLDCLVVTN